MIHSSAIVDPQARLAPGVAVGAYSVIGPYVEVGEGTWIGPHVVVNGPSRIGRDNRIYQFASVGEQPQDKKYAGEATTLELGDRNTIREGATLSRGTVQGLGTTRIGDDNWIMAYAHVAHDCIVGSNTIFANGTSLAGHVVVGDYAILGGFTLIHQFCRVGAHCFCSMGAAIRRDVPPYVTVAGDPAAPHGINSEGLRRRGFGPERVALIKRAYRTLYRSSLRLSEAVEALRVMQDPHGDLERICSFIDGSARGIAR